MEEEQDEEAAKKYKSLRAIPLLAPSAILAATAGNFTATHADQQELAVATCERVCLYNVNEDYEADLLWSFDHPGILTIHMIPNRYMVALHA